MAGLLAVALGCGRGGPAEEPVTERPEGEEPLVVASFGGAWQDAQRKAMFEPFAQASGVQVVDAEYDRAYALIRENAWLEKNR